MLVSLSVVNFLDVIVYSIHINRSQFWWRCTVEICT